MRFLKRVAGFLGFGKDESHEAKEDDDDVNRNNSDDNHRNRMNVDPIHAGPRKGFSVPVQVPVERPVVGPILVPCNGDGGLQVTYLIPLLVIFLILGVLFNYFVMCD